MFFGGWQNWLSLILVLSIILIAVAAPILSPNDPKEPGPFKRVGRAVEARPLPPDEKAILGMLPRGIDVYHALVWGTRDALKFGLLVTFFSALFGVLYGAVSGYIEGRIGGLMLRITDAFLAFPIIAGVVFLQQLYMSTVTALGGHYYEGIIFTISGESIRATPIQLLLERVNPLMVSLIIFSWMAYARLVHSVVITLKQTDFIQAARAMGGNFPWIIRRHLLPNSTAPAIVLAAREVGGIVLLQATLTFIGIGGESVWGNMLADGRDWILGPGGNILTYWWVFLPPTVAVILFGVAWNMFGDSLNDFFLPESYSGSRGRSFWKRSRKTDSAVDEDKKAPPVFDGQTAPPMADNAPASDLEGRKPSSPMGDPMLATARQDVQQGDLANALHAYSHMIHKGRSIDEILPDLAQLARKHPRDPRVWQTLGDALTQAGDLDHARQSYAQSQKLRQSGTIGR